MAINKIRSVYNGMVTPNLASRGLDTGLLILRLATAGMMLGAHGWGKLISYSDNMHGFPDPLGVGSPISLALAVFAEFFCSLLVLLGLFTRAACVPLMITMLVAALIIHADDPWGRKEFALLYFFPFLTLLLTGPGRFSLDNRLGMR